MRRVTLALVVSAAVGVIAVAPASGTREKSQRGPDNLFWSAED